ncbi:hypothetical protein ACFY1S_26230, partial [Micromonospora sp. NPDC000663]
MNMRRSKPRKRLTGFLLAIAASFIVLVYLPTGPAKAACASIPPNRDFNVTTMVHQTGIELGVSDRVMLAGFEAGWVESRMNNLACGDKDSLGVFQQRPSQGWGTPEQIMNVSYAATRFFNAAKASEANHPTFAAWQIAQDVQRSCCPDRYAAAESTARSLIAEVQLTPRFAFADSAGLVLAKDGSHSGWGSAINSGG